MSNEFYTILTDAGLVAIANASVSSSTINFAKVMVGDGNGSYYTPTKDMTALRNKKWEGPVSSVEIDPTNPNWVTVEAVIPATDGGFYIREIGIANEAGTLLAIGKLPETYKPALDSGSTKDLFLRAIFEVSNASVITLRADPSVVLASRKFVEDKIAVVSGKVTKLQEDFASHIEQSTSQYISVMREANIEGIQVVSGFNQMPKFLLIESIVAQSKKVSFGRVAKDYQHRITFDYSGVVSISTVGSIAIIDSSVDYTIGTVTINSDKTISIDWTKYGAGGTGTVNVRITALYY